ncbi:MAG: nucleotidyltransferase domain-containing protein [bacterium]
MASCVRKPSALRRRSSGSVTVVFLDKNAAIGELRECAEILVREDSRALAVGVFGSLARGDAVPSSDADVLIVLSGHEQKRWFDRIPEYGDFFAGTSLAVEPFPYVIDEIRNMLKHVGFMRTAVRELLPLAGDPQIFQQLQEEISIAE